MSWMAQVAWCILANCTVAVGLAVLQALAEAPLGTGYHVSTFLPMRLQEMSIAGVLVGCAVGTIDYLVRSWRPPLRLTLCGFLVGAVLVPAGQRPFVLSRASWKSRIEGVPEYQAVIEELGPARFICGALTGAGIGYLLGLASLKGQPRAKLIYQASIMAGVVGAGIASGLVAIGYPDALMIVAAFGSVAGALFVGLVLGLFRPNPGPGEPFVPGQ
jgi:hypothetical protein